MNELVWLSLRILKRTRKLEKRIMTKIDDAVARLEASSTASTAALTALINAGNTEIQQVADALAAENPDTDALAARLNTVGDAFDAGVAAANAATDSLGKDDPAPAGGGTGTGSGSGSGSGSSSGSGSTGGAGGDASGFPA